MKRNLETSKLFGIRKTASHKIALPESPEWKMAELITALRKKLYSKRNAEKLKPPQY